MSEAESKVTPMANPESAAAPRIKLGSESEVTPRIQPESVNEIRARNQEQGAEIRWQEPLLDAPGLWEIRGRSLVSTV